MQIQLLQIRQHFSSIDRKFQRHPAFVTRRLLYTCRSRSPSILDLSSRSRYKSINLGQPQFIQPYIQITPKYQSQHEPGRRSAVNVPKLQFHQSAHQFRQPCLSVPERAMSTYEKPFGRNQAVKQAEQPEIKQAIHIQKPEQQQQLNCQNEEVGNIIKDLKAYFKGKDEAAYEQYIKQIPHDSVDYTSPIPEDVDQNTQLNYITKGLAKITQNSASAIKSPANSEYYQLISNSKSKRKTQEIKAKPHIIHYNKIDLSKSSRSNHQDSGRKSSQRVPSPSLLQQQPYVVQFELNKTNKKSRISIPKGNSKQKIVINMAPKFTKKF